jgi:hypothetical protein
MTCPSKAKIHPRKKFFGENEKKLPKNLVDRKKGIIFAA